MPANQAIFTIVTKSYLAFARVMAKELGLRCPGMPFYVFLADGPDGYFEPENEPFRVIKLEEFLPSSLRSTMSGYYTAYEFCNALKPFAHLHLATIIGAERWFYLDSDIYLCGNLNSLFAELDDCSILLTCHILKPVHLEIAEPLELSFLRAGIYNGGVVGLKNSTTATDFLRWWKDRLIWNCLHSEPGLEADQSWLNFVPLFFSDVKILKDPEVNVAYWNFHERELQLGIDGIVRVAEKSIPFLHFSGWDWRIPDKISIHASSSLGISEPAWNHLSSAYLQSLIQESVQITSRWPYSFAISADGQDITPAMRRKFLRYCRKHAGHSLEAGLDSNPEMFRDPLPKPISLFNATTIFIGALLRTLQLRK